MADQITGREKAAVSPSAAKQKGKEQRVKKKRRTKINNKKEKKTPTVQTSEQQDSSSVETAAGMRDGGSTETAKLRKGGRKLALAISPNPDSLWPRVVCELQRVGMMISSPTPPLRLDTPSTFGGRQLYRFSAALNRGEKSFPGFPYGVSIDGKYFTIRDAKDMVEKQWVIKGTLTPATSDSFASSHTEQLVISRRFERSLAKHSTHPNLFLEFKGPYGKKAGKNGQRQEVIVYAPAGEPLCILDGAVVEFKRHEAAFRLLWTTAGSSETGGGGSFIGIIFGTRGGGGALANFLETRAGGGKCVHATPRPTLSDTKTACGRTAVEGYRPSGRCGGDQASGNGSTGTEKQADERGLA
jgi:hypothetical protein